MGPVPGRRPTTAVWGRGHSAKEGQLRDFPQATRDLERPGEGQRSEDQTIDKFSLAHLLSKRSEEFSANLY